MTPQIHLRQYGEDDFEILKATLGDPTMTEYLGGPASEEALRTRHQRYVELVDSPSEGMYVILAGEDRTPAGAVGYWEREHEGEQGWETGWSVLPAFQNQGIATRATQMVIDLLRADGRRRYLYAYPTVENLPSNAVCRKTGFVLEGVGDYEYPAGNPIHCNIWRYDLTQHQHERPKSE